MIVKLKINGTLWTGDIHDAPVKSGDVVECTRPIAFERPTYLWEGVEGITFHCPVLANVILDPVNETAIYWPDGTEAARYAPAPWVADWVRPDGLGVVGRQVLKLPEVEERILLAQELQSKANEIEAQISQLNKPAENTEVRSLFRRAIRNGMGRVEAERLLGCVIPPDYVEGNWVEEVS